MVNVGGLETDRRQPYSGNRAIAHRSLRCATRGEIKRMFHEVMYIYWLIEESHSTRRHIQRSIHLLHQASGRSCMYVGYTLRMIYLFGFIDRSRPTRVTRQFYVHFYALSTKILARSRKYDRRKTHIDFLARLGHHVCM